MNHLQTSIPAEECNSIKQVTVSELLDGRYFFIPSYQRGYRWTKKQIYDLCNDLLEYILKKNESFYSLQPLIVRKDSFQIEGKDETAYEVIDGQQRLTSIFIMYRFLAKELNYNSLDQVSNDYGGNRLYHIYYQTRPDDYAALEESGFKEMCARDIKDIDIAHISNAYQYLKNWLYNSVEDDSECAAATFPLFSKEKFAAKTVKDNLFNLLNNINSSNTPGSLQFILYEIDGSKDAIREFLCENKGKIRLTDTEMIKALFMQRSNFESNVKNLKQLSIAKDWELIENTLHRNDFWAFISKDTQLEDGRINVIFNYIFDCDTENHAYANDEDYLFRYYYQKFARIKKDDLACNVSNGVDDLWNKVMDCFRMLQNWFQNPKIYNLVGLLVKHGYSIRQISEIYDRPSIETTDDFIKGLNTEIRKEIIDKIPIDKGQSELGIDEKDEYVRLFYNNSSDKIRMLDLFRFLNVMELNNTIDKALEDIDKDPDEKKRTDARRSARDVLSHIYRFPYEALDVFGWDIEHIDSATTNSLTDPKEQEDWLKEAQSAIGDILEKDNSYRALLEAYSNPGNTDKDSTLKSLVDRVHAIVGEEESDLLKNWIGNLTLLDSGTNRSYKNKIFAWKSQIIRTRIQRGVFVPICTQNIFSKNYEGCSDDRWKWSTADKRAYHSYILEKIKSFKSQYSDATIDDKTDI